MVSIQDIGEILQNSLSANNEVRNAAEKQMSILVKEEENIRLIYEYCQNSNNNSASRHMAMICFSRSLESNYDQYSETQWMGQLVNSILEGLSREIENTYDFYTRIMELLFRKNSVHLPLLEKHVIEYVHSSDRNCILAGLAGLQCCQRRQRRSVTNLERRLIYEDADFFVTLGTTAAACGDWVMARVWTNIVANAHANSCVEKNQTHTHRSDCAVFPEKYTGVALGLIETIGSLDNDDFVKTQRWATKLVCKYSQCLKDVTSDKTAPVWQQTVAALRKLLNQHLRCPQGRPKESAKIVECVAQLFSGLAEKRQWKTSVVAQSQWLVYELILPTHVYNESMEECFEYNVAQYLDGRYNNDCDNIRSVTASLFDTLLRLDHTVRDELVPDLVRLFTSGRGQPMYKEYRYAIIGLLACTQESLRKVLGSERYAAFIMCEIFPDIADSDNFIVSQALYFLSHVGVVGVQMDIKDYYCRIIRMTTAFNADSHNSSPIPVEAALALNFFLMNNPDIIRPMVKDVFMIVAELSRTYFLSGLQQLMDTLIDKFPEEILLVTPELAESICRGLLPALRKYTNDDSCDVVCGYLNTLDQLILNADSQEAAVQKIYLYVHDVISIIFDKGLCNLYQEAMGIFNSVLFALQRVDDSMLNLLERILAADPIELGYLPSEIKDLLDNFFSYGRDAVVRPQIITLIDRLLFEGLMPPEVDSFDDIYEDTLESLCRIIDSLVTNTDVATFIQVYPAVFHRFIIQLNRIYDMVKSDDFMAVTTLVTLMNCVSVAPNDTLSVIGARFPQLFEDIHGFLTCFRRVYDKKVLLIFLGSLLRHAETLPINMYLFNDALVTAFGTLPAAIKKRNLLRAREYDTEDNSECESEYECTASDYDMFEEDIWFESAIDKFDVYTYIRKLLEAPQPHTFGALAITNMSQTQIGRINEILSVEQEQQK